MRSGVFRLGSLFYSLATAPCFNFCRAVLFLVVLFWAAVASVSSTLIVDWWMWERSWPGFRKSHEQAHHVTRMCVGVGTSVSFYGRPFVSIVRMVWSRFSSYIRAGVLQAARKWAKPRALMACWRWQSRLVGCLSFVTQPNISLLGQMICMICMICMIYFPTTDHDLDLPSRVDIFLMLYDL